MVWFAPARGYGRGAVLVIRDRGGRGAIGDRPSGAPADARKQPSRRRARRLDGSAAAAEYSGQVATKARDAFDPFQQTDIDERRQAAQPASAFALRPEPDGRRAGATHGFAQPWPRPGIACGAT
ncbi:hypothetical protein WS86_15395 [Burkholderia savannae]|nr:hypothetical protein WS86_15395 [Burkholderia savannae]